MGGKYLDRRQFLFFISALCSTGIQEVRTLTIQDKEGFDISDSGYGSGVYGGGPFGGSDGSSSLSGIAAEYDANDDGTISLQELSNAAQDYSQGEISLQDLSEVATAATE